jgi:hypothetical protein
LNEGKRACSRFGGASAAGQIHDEKQKRIAPRRAFIWRVYMTWQFGFRFEFLDREGINRSWCVSVSTLALLLPLPTYLNWSGKARHLELITQLRGPSFCLTQQSTLSFLFFLLAHIVQPILLYSAPTKSEIGHKNRGTTS